MIEKEAVVLLVHFLLCCLERARESEGEGGRESVAVRNG